MKKFLIDNWKTNLLGVLCLGILGAYIFKLIDTEQLITIQGFLVATGWFLVQEAKMNNDKPDVPPEDQ